MATKQQIMNIIKAGNGEPVSRATIAERLGEPISNFQTQLDRWIKQELIESDGEHRYTLTDVGSKEAIDDEAELIGDEKDMMSDENLGATEYQQFIKLGKITGGMPVPLIIQSANHVWNGGDYNDLNWVAEAFKQMGIRRDLAIRWWHSWRSFLKQPIPQQPPEFVNQPLSSEKGDKADTPKGKASLSHDIDENGNPVYVGEGLGALTHDEAFELSKIKASAKVKGNGQSRSESPGDSLAARAVEKIISDMTIPAGEPVDETSKVITQIKAIKELLGVEEKGNSGDETTKLISAFTALKELFGDNRPPVNTNMVKQLLVDRQTGKVEEVPSGQPMIIMRDSAPAVSQATPIQIKDKDGNPMVLDLSTYINLEDHRDKQRREEESHQVKMDIAKTFKDALGKAGKALANMGEGEE